MPDLSTDGALTVTRTPFVVVPCWVVQLGPKALGAYVALSCHTAGAGGECHPKLRTLAKAAGVCENTIRSGIAILEEHGAVVVTPRYGEDGSQLANDYRLRVDPPADRESPPSHVVDDPPAPDGDHDQEPRTKKDDPDGSSMSEIERADVFAVCEQLARHVESQTGRSPLVTVAWRKDARLMLDRDGWTLPQVEYVIRWLGGTGERSQFWSMNVRCPGKLRKQMQRLVDEIRHERNVRPRTDVASRIAGIRSLADTTTPRRRSLRDIAS